MKNKFTAWYDSKVRTVEERVQELAQEGVYAERKERDSDLVKLCENSYFQNQLVECGSFRTYEDGIEVCIEHQEVKFKNQGNSAIFDRGIILPTNKHSEAHYYEFWIRMD